MKKTAILLLTLISIVVSAHGFSKEEEKEILGLYSKAEREYWIYMDNLIQEKDAYELYKASKKVEYTLRTIRLKFKNRDKVTEGSIPDLILRFSFLAEESMATPKGSKTNELKEGESKYEEHKAFITDRQKVTSSLVSVAEEINKNSELLEANEFPIYKKLKEAVKALQHRERFYLVLLRCQEVENNLLELIRQEDLDFSADSMIRVFGMAIADSRSLYKELGNYEGDEKLKALTRDFLSFYKQESERLVHVTKSYYSAMDKYEKSKVEYNKIGKESLTQEQYNAFRHISNDVVNKQKIWRDERSLQDAKRAKLNMAWRQEAVFFMQNWMYKNVPDYRKPDHISVYTLYN